MDAVLGRSGKKSSERSSVYFRLTVFAMEIIMVGDVPLDVKRIAHTWKKKQLGRIKYWNDGLRGLNYVTLSFGLIS